MRYEGGLKGMEMDVQGTVRRFVRSSVMHNPFLRNFEPAIQGEERRVQKIAEGIVLDAFIPGSQVSYLLIGGLPGSGKTTLADAIADTIKCASLGMWIVERRSFSQFRQRAIAEMLEEGVSWTKAEETRRATECMKKDTLRTMQEGPFNKDGVRRIVVAEMPVYPVDEKERGLEVVRAIGETERDVPYELRRARVNFLRPDLDVIKNALITRLMRMSAGGSAEAIYEIAYKAYAGALLFHQLQQEPYKQLKQLLRKQSSRYMYLTQRSSPAVAASNMIALRMLTILREYGLHGPYDTVLMNPSRKSLLSLSRRVPQKSMND